MKWAHGYNSELHNQLHSHVAYTANRDTRLLVARGIAFVAHGIDKHTHTQPSIDSNQLAVSEQKQTKSEEKNTPKQHDSQRPPQHNTARQMTHTIAIKGNKDLLWTGNFGQSTHHSAIK